MKLNEFAEKIVATNEIFLDSRGKIIPIMIWQDLIRKDGFSKTMEHKYLRLSEKDFVYMARKPITLPVLPVLKLVAADPYKSQDTTINTITFYPDTDEGWAGETETEIRVHLYYYEK